VLVRSITTFLGTGKVRSIGISVHLVPTETSLIAHVLQEIVSIILEYSPANWSHAVHSNEPTNCENFPASHGAQETAPNVLARPGSHFSQLVDGGRVPFEPAGHARNESQSSSWQLVMYDPSGTLTAAAPPARTTNPTPECWQVVCAVSFVNVSFPQSSHLSAPFSG
jgi:hypothetical protein